MKSAIYFIALFSVVLLPGTHAIGEEKQLSERDQAVKFIKSKVVGKKLIHNSTVIIDGGKLEAEFSRDVTFCNLTETAEGFSFDLMFVIKQTNHALDGDGKRTGHKRVENRTGSQRYEVRERRSTGKILGIRRVVTNTLNDPIGEAESVMLQCDGTKLTVRLTTVGYADFFTANGKEKPGVAETEEEFTVGKDGLNYTVTAHYFDVDPVTLARKPSGKPSTLVSKEEKR